MASVIEDIRALLLQFERSDLQDLHWRGAEWSVFMARGEGAANPLLASQADRQEGEKSSTVFVSAPHLGMFGADCAVGQVVGNETLIGVIDVLGRKTNVLSEKAGTIVAVCASQGGLVEYGDRLVEIAVA
ncbi:MAG: hypothetical protein NVS3B5_09030 [Sphingomicrobium sp.]